MNRWPRKLMVAGVAAIATLGMMPAVALAEWASYAYSLNGDFGFAAYLHATQAEAEQAALAGCAQGATGAKEAKPLPDCQVLISTPNWLAIAQTESQVFWQTGGSQQMVEETVIKTCKRQEPKQKCQLRLTINGFEGVKYSLYGAR